MAPCPSRISELEMRTCRVGTGPSLATEILPDLIAMQSSPVEMWAPAIRTSWHDSGLIPSVLGDVIGASTFTRAMLSCLQRKGCKVQEGELHSVTPSIA